MYSDDTIAAISTAHGTGGIGIIRISGENAFRITEIIFIGKKHFSHIKSHTINYGKIIDNLSGETIDEVLVTKMKGPNTFTREDVIEINCHGGIIVLKKIIEVIIKNGARLAEPGEFTKRAFLNGRIDLSQAEAVIDLINSKTSESSRAAVNQLEGKLSKKLKDVRKRLIELIAHIEVTVDYPEHDIDEITGQQVYDALNEINKSLLILSESFEKGRILREGINVVIVGKPNVGKSSLLNELSGKNKAIVTDIPGTTRDIIEEYININGIPVRLLDTAGIRQTEDIVEKIGVEKAHSALEDADLIIFIIDASLELIDEDYDLINKIKDKKVVVLLNKIDIVEKSKIENIEKLIPIENIIKTSIKNDIGIKDLEEKITALFISGGINTSNEFLITNVRHKNLIDNALKSIEFATNAYEGGMPLDCLAIDIKSAAESIGQITGESVSEDVMHEIFSRFCLGK